SNGNGTVRLRNNSNAVLLEVNYSDEPPWAVAADGAGHSLVLARPSWGESHPKAWNASAVKGGSPGAPEPAGAGPLANILINEICVCTNSPDHRFVELYNHSSSLVNVSGCYLNDDPVTNRFRIAAGTGIAARGFRLFTETEI